MLFWLCDVLNKISWDPDVDPALREVCGRLATDVDLSFLNRDECALWRAVERLKEAAAEAHRASVAQYSLKEDGRLHEVVSAVLLQLALTLRYQVLEHATWSALDEPPADYLAARSARLPYHRYVARR
ncbi:MAG: hypothetical protein KatS3mg023_3676 [Armatimonadota bacterium]|nr:MAG: hypothetical protein KatS3mg023_3676 [Armatimonadota bacterium]